MIITARDTFITMSVSDKPSYTSQISILGRQFTLTCGYNTRNKLRWITVEDANGQPVLSQTFLKNGKLCQLNFLANRYGLSFSVTLKPKSSTTTIADDYDYLEWSNDFDLYFVGRLQTTEEDMRVNLRKVYVGN